VGFPPPEVFPPETQRGADRRFGPISYSASAEKGTIMTFALKSLLARRARYSRLLTLSLFVAMASKGLALSAPQRIFRPQTAPRRVVSHSPAALPYLAKFGAVPLRFAPPPPEATERPAPPEPAHPIETPPPAAQSSSLPPAASSESSSAPATGSTEPTNKLMRILPDDTPHNVRTEDVMSYFQLPPPSERSNVSGVNVPFAPAQPGGSTVPPSSATYQQK